VQVELPDLQTRHVLMFIVGSERLHSWHIIPFCLTIVQTSQNLTMRSCRDICPSAS